MAVHPARLDKAKRIIAEQIKIIGEDGFYDVLYELHWVEVVPLSYSEFGNLQVELEDLQAIALAAALLAYVEGQIYEQQAQEPAQWE